MKIADVFAGTNTVCFDTAPIIYFVENHPNYADKMESIIEYIDDHKIDIVCASLTLTETLVKPLQLGDQDVVEVYEEFLKSPSIRLISITSRIAKLAATLRATYNLKTPDALHVAVAVDTECDVFLTNDSGIKRVQELSVITLDELDLPSVETE